MSRILQSARSGAAACLSGVAPEKRGARASICVLGDLVQRTALPLDPRGRDLAVVDDSLRIDPAELDPITWLGGNTCATIRDRFDMATPTYNQ